MALEWLEEARVLATKHEFAQWIALLTGRQGQALAQQGDNQAGITLLQQGLMAFRATGVIGGAVPNLLTSLAEAYGNVGQIEEGLALLADAQAHVGKTAERTHEAEGYRLKGGLLLKQIPPDEHQAEACFHQALSIARCQQAKSLELRAATSLARLWQQQGKRRDAYELLASVYGCFTEGFDTADLKDAKMLLEELG